MRREVIWLPGVVVLFVFQLVVFARGLVRGLPVESREVFTWSVGLVACSVALLVVAIAIPTHWLRGLSASCALVALALAVSADTFVVATVVAGASSVPPVMAGLCLGLWWAEWSLTDRPAPQ
jgi:hypothetical protein